MSVPKANKYTFLTWVKTGLGASILDNEEGLKGPRAMIQAKLKVRRYDAENKTSEEPISKDFFLYGPGDIQGILNQVIIRIEPSPNNLNFESNYFPFIEFSQPDFPWKYTPAKPVGSQLSSRLSPWLSLIVLEQNEFNDIPSNEPSLLPKIEIIDPKTSLPDLKQSWAAAHIQINQELEKFEAFRKILDTEPYKVTSRIMSLRKLKPNTRYSAFVVPTFEVGRLAGLGCPSKSDIKGTLFSWSVESDDHYHLPVYYQWKFGTGPSGDFESLAKRLEFRELPKEVGIKKIDVSEAFLSAGNITGFEKPLLFGGALWSSLAEEFIRTRKKINLETYSIEEPDSENPDPENPSPAEVKQFIMVMKELVDLGERLTWSFVESPHFPNECEDPVISPPMYGKWHARKKLVSNISSDYKDPPWIDALNLQAPNILLEEIRKYSPNENKWIEELNLDPTNRVAAGLGAAIIQKLQEELMASAWDQAGQLRESNKHLRNSQLAREISSNIYERSFQPLEPNDLITMVSTFHSIVNVKHENKSASVKRWLRDKQIPEAIFSPAFTKISTKYNRIQRKMFDFKPSISSYILDHFKKRGSAGDIEAVSLESSKPGRLLTLDYLVDSPILDVLHILITEDGFKGNELTLYLNNVDVPNNEREMVRSIENSIPNAGSTADTDEQPQDVDSLLGAIYNELINSLDPKHSIESKMLMEVERPERLHEETKDKLDIVVAYPEFKRPMFEPLRDLSEDFLLPGIKHIPQDTIGILQTNPTFINSYLVGLNHEMARELLWRGYRTDQRGSYFRQFWDAAAAVEKERMIHFQNIGTSPLEEEDEKIIEKYRDIPEIHRWKESKHQDIRRIAQPEGADRPEMSVLLIRGELLMRYPGTVIYATKAITDNNNNNNNKPVLSINDNDIKEPVFRGTIPPDITFLGFDISFLELLGNHKNNDLGYFFIIQEQHSEARFGIDNNNGNDSTDSDGLPKSWNDLKWNHVESSLGPNNYIDLEGDLKGLKLENNVEWGSHAAHLAYILLQQPFRIVVHARELFKTKM